MSDERVTAAHGAGTERTRELLDRVVTDRFGDGDATVGLAALDDGAVLADGETVVTTDSHVVDPIEFPGGDIGRLAVSGTVNDLAAMGATEDLTLSCALVIEAGTPVETIDRVTRSMAEAAAAADATIRTGDTKVMRDVDGLVVTTTGVGRTPEPLAADRLEPGDRLVVTGPVGDHGVALLAAREGFEFASPLESDVRPVADLVAAAREAGRVKTATDPTRGGLAAAANELADASDVGVTLDDRAIPVTEATAGGADVLGLDPYTVACEGRMVLGVAAEDAERVCDRLREEVGGDADGDTPDDGPAVIGTAVEGHPGRVVLDTGIGERYLTVPTGERVPRIC